MKRYFATRSDEWPERPWEQGFLIALAVRGSKRKLPPSTHDLYMWDHLLVPPPPPPHGGMGGGGGGVLAGPATYQRLDFLGFSALLSFPPSRLLFLGGVRFFLPLTNEKRKHVNVASFAEGPRPTPPAARPRTSWLENRPSSTTTLQTRFPQNWSCLWSEESRVVQPHHSDDDQSIQVSGNSPTLPRLGLGFGLG